MSRRREWLAGLLLAAGGLVFALLLLEAGVRWMHLVPDRFWEADPVLGVRLIPGESGWWTQEEREFVVPVHVNSHGLRDVEHTFAKDADTFRILILGDSFVEALHVPLGDAFPRRLQRLFDARPRQRRIEVISAGVSGYGTAGEVLFFERDGQRYRPDLVVLAFYPGNDVKNNSPTLESTFPPVYADDGSPERVRAVSAPSGRGGWRPRWQTARFLRKALLTRFPWLTGELAEHGVLQRNAAQAPALRDGIPVDYGVYLDPPDEEWRMAWQHTEQLLERLLRSAHTAGAQLAVAILSTRDATYPDSWNEVLQTYPAMRGHDWDLQAPARRVRAWCDRHGVACVDLAPPFRAAAARGGDLLHYRHDGHWTPAGHELAAAVLLGFLDDSELVPAPKSIAKH